MSTSSRSLSTSQAADRLSLSREHIRRLIQQGELRAEETVNGFMLDASDVERYAFQRRVLQDQRQFRVAMDDLATRSRRVDEATDIQSAVAHVRDLMKLHSAFEVPAVVAPQVQWIEREVAARKALTALAGPVETLVEQWHRYDEDTRHAMNPAAVQAGHDTGVASAPDASAEKIIAAFAKPPTEMTPRPSELARGFVVAESREARLEEKVDELSRKVKQLTELVTQQRADTAPDTPTWQQWARSDRPEDILAKLDAVREEVSGGKQMPENSTDIIRESRHIRGRDA